MINHTVLITFQRQLSAIEQSAIIEAARNMKSKIMEIRDMRFGVDIGLSSEPGNSFSLTATFDSIEGYKTYQTHPVHQEFIEKHIKPLLAERRAIQYEIS
jgi:hypothetical protein